MVALNRVKMTTLYEEVERGDPGTRWLSALLQHNLIPILNTASEFERVARACCCRCALRF